jgi:hypothetical protein
VRYKERRRRRSKRRRRGDEEEEEDERWSVVLWTDRGPLNRRRLYKNGKSYLD